MHPDDGRVVPNFIMQALKGHQITVYGKGDQTRSFCYIDDLTDALVAFMATPDYHTGPFNIGNPTEHTIMELAELIITLTDSKSTIVHRALPQDDPSQRKPDISKARVALGWTPKVALRDGLVETIRYFQEHIA
jgi:UDP-glucuronate decarboxylase